MKESTIKKFISNINRVIELDTTYNQYEQDGNICVNYFSVMAQYIKKAIEKKNSKTNLVLAQEALDLFKSNRCMGKKFSKIVEDNSVKRDFIETLRDEEDKISGYTFKILIRDKQPLTGNLTRDEMNMVYRLYSNYGTSLTQREISRFFPEYSLEDFKRILRAFSITKASSPFAPHVIEETSPEELISMQLREKENDFLRKLENETVANNAKLLKACVKENIELKENYKDVVNAVKDIINVEPTKYKLNKNSLIVSDNDLILHLADLHIGAKVESGSIYQNEYNLKEVESRLHNLLTSITSLNMRFKTIVINLLGDNIDGIDNQTARRDHYMPQNMDNMEQVKGFISVMQNFVASLREMSICNNIKIYAVKCGNHDGIVGYTASMALKYKLEALFDNVEFTLFDTFFGHYKFCGHDWIISHGKDEKFMKRGLPINLDEKSKIMIYDWMAENGITGYNVHFIKGDLHSDNLNSCARIDYRNCLSLFGNSDYSNYNFAKNNYGVSYELLINDNLIRGTFINL